MLNREEFLSRFEPQAEVQPPQPESVVSDSRDTPLTPTYPNPEDVFDNSDLVDDASAGAAIKGTFAGVGVELGAGFGGTTLLKYSALGRRVLNIGRAGKIAAGAQAATGAGALSGAITFAASEAAIWGASNFLGQQTRKAFGIQEETSAAEMLAASLFGASVVTRGAERLFKMGSGVNDLNAWKNMTGTLSNKRAFLSGASLGMAETFMRQELEQLMNEDANRNAYEYLFAGALGGGFNTVFNAWARSGDWGIDQMRQLSNRALKANDNAIAEVKEQIGKTSDRRQRSRLRKRLVELEKSRKNLVDFEEHTQKTQEAYGALNTKKTDSEEISPEDLASEQARRQQETAPPTEQPRIPETEEPVPTPKEEPLPTTKEEEEAPKITRDQEDIVTTDEETDFSFSTGQNDVLDAVKQSEVELKAVERGNYGTVGGNIARRLKPRQEKLTVDVDSKVRALIRKRQTGEDISVEDVTALQSDVYLLRRMNDTLDLVETNGGRSLQALSQDASKYGRYISQYSLRSYAQRDALIRFQNSLDFFSPGGPGKASDVIDNIEEYLSIPEKFGLTGRLRFGEFEDLRGELDEMEWDDIKTLARDYNDKLPEGATPIKLSGKGVTRQAIKDRIAKDFQAKRESGKVQGRIRKTIETLEQSLTRIRSRHFVTETETPIGGPLAVDKYGKELVEETEQTAVAKATKEALENNPDVLRLKATIKYYKDSVDDLDRIEKLEKELDELAGIEGRGVISEIEQKVLKKYKISPPQVKTKVDELRTKIAESKKRMKDKIKDIRKAEKELETARVLKDYEESLSAALDVAPSGKFMKVLQTGNTWRKMNLINQLPSVLAGVPTSIYATIREGLARPAVTALRSFADKDKDIPLHLALAYDEASAFWSGFFSRNGIKESAKRAFREGRDPTTGHLTRFADDFRSTMTLEGTLQRIKRKAVTAADSKEALDSIMSKFNIANLTNLFSAGIRGIGALDAVTKRQLVQGTLAGQARKQARLELHKKPGVTEEQILDRAEEIYKSKWKDDDGLQVLDVLGDHEQFVDDIQESILLARQHMTPEEIHKDFGDRIIDLIKKASGSSEEAELLVGMFMPYISVPVRGAYQGLRLTLPVNFLQARYANPYEKQLKKFEESLKERQAGAAVSREKLQDKNLSDTARELQEGIIQEAEQFAQKAGEKRARLTRYADNYTQNALMNDTIAFGLFIAGYGMGLTGAMTGSLNWMSVDQRKKNKLEPFTGMGMDYRAASPIAIPLAIGADLAHYFTLRERGQLNDSQNVFGMFADTIITLTSEVPLFQGMKTLQKITGGGPDTIVSEVGNIASGYAPIPAQVRKTIQAAAVAGGDRTVADMRGSTFEDRLTYKIFGVKPINRVTNRFGEDVVGSHTMFTLGVSRQLPKRPQETLTKFEKILTTDYKNQVGNPPATFIGQNMHKFVDEEGMTLYYAFMKEVEKRRVKVDGSARMTLKEAVNKLISTNKWTKLYEEENFQRTATGKPYNEGLRELNALMQKYYDAVETELSKDKRFMKRFLGAKNETLDKILKFDKDIPFRRTSLNLKFD